MSEQNDWVPNRLRFVASIRNSNVDKKSYDGQEPVLLCNYTDVYYNEKITSREGLMEAPASQSEIEKFSLKAGDVIITKDSETADDIGIPAWVPQDLPGVVCGYHLTQLRSNEAVTPEFLFRTMQATSTRQYLEVETPGVTRFGLDQDTIGSIPVLVPPKEVQVAIASHLDRATARIDALVAKKTRFIELLREKRQALIAHAVTKGLDAGVPMKDSGVEWLGHVPAHWDVVQSRRLFSERNQKARPDDQQLTASQKYGLLPQAEFMEREGRRIVVVQKGHDILKRTLRGDFVISMRSFQGGLELSEHEGSVSSAYVPITPTKWVVPAFFRWAFKSITYIQALQATSDLVRDGQALRFENFTKVPLPHVPEDEQKAIADFLDHATARIDTLIAKTERSIDLLREYRTALITAAVTGKLDLREAA